MFSNLQESPANEHQDFPPRLSAEAFLFSFTSSIKVGAAFWERAHARGDRLPQRGRGPSTKASPREGPLNGAVKKFSSQGGIIRGKNAVTNRKKNVNMYIEKQESPEGATRQKIFSAIFQAVGQPWERGLKQTDLGFRKEATMADCWTNWSMKKEVKGSVRLCK